MAAKTNWVNGQQVAATDLNTLGTEVNSKVDKVTGKGLSTEDYTSAEKTKLAGIAAGAEVNVNPDWDAVSGDGQILNKPTLGTAAAADSDDFATAAQGVLADTATQPGDLAAVATTGAYTDLTGAPTIPDELTDLDTTVTGAQLNALKTKVDGVASGATANSSDATLLDRANHTGTQPSSTISDFTEAVQDAVGALLGAGTNVVVDYDDTANTLTISATGGGEGGLSVEDVRDAIGAAMVGAGLISVAYNDALDTITISTTATANDTDANLRNRANHTGTQSADTIVDGTTNHVFTAADDTKLAGIEDGAQVNTVETLTDLGITATATELNYVDGVTSAIQTQLDGKQAADADLTAIAGLSASNDDVLQRKAGGWTNRTPAQVKTDLALSKSDVGLGNVDNTSDANKTLTNPTVNNYTEGVVAIGNSGTAKTIDLTSGTVQTCTLTGNCTFTMPTATAGKSFVLLLKTGAGSFTATFTGVKWPASTAPTITTTASRLDMLTFVADGSVWYGASAQNYTP